MRLLKKLCLQNYRCFEKTEISFRGTSIIVGNNNAGKSTIIEALRIVAEAAQKIKKASYVSAPSELELPVVEKGFNIKFDHLKIDLRTIVYRYKEDAVARIKAQFDNDAFIRVYLTTEIAFATIEYNKQIVTSKTLAQRMPDLELYVMPQIGLIREDEPHISEETVKKDMSTRLSSRHFRNELLLYKDHYFDKFRMIAEETWPGLRIGDISWRMGENVSLFVTDDDFVAEIGMMGSGLQMWLQIVWFISHCPANATIVLDEPDVYMHPDLQRKILKIVQQEFNQVIIATHSIEIISGVEPSQIVILDKKSRKMNYANNYRAVQDVIANLGSEHNLSLVRIGNYKKCVFVEGKDISTLTKIQNVLSPRCQFALDQLPTVALGGWSRFQEALGTARLFYEETSGAIETICILDRDYHTQSEIEERYQLAQESHLNLIIWQRKEIENYILSPRAIAKVAGIDVETDTYSSFCDSLFDALDELRYQTLAAILNQLHAQDRRREPGDFLLEAKGILDQQWETLEGRLSIACGKDLISLINSWVKQEYGRSCSRAKIISKLTAEDIPQEMKDTINHLAK